MTAIIAYAEAGYAFVAADSSRTLSGGIYHQTVKVYSWSDKVIFAQSGNATQQYCMITQMLAGRGVSYLHDMSGFEAAWLASQPHWQKKAARLKSKNSSVATDGTILAADAASGEVKSFDFATGTVSIVAAFGYAGFPNVGPAATAAWGAGRRDLDMWAVDTINPLCASNSGIDWPIDLMLCVPLPYERTISTRLASKPSIGKPDFLLP